MTRLVGQSLLLLLLGSLAGWLWRPESLTLRRPKIAEGTVPDAAAVSIDVDEARELFRRGEAAFIDSRTREEYEKGHVAGALAANDKGLVSLLPVIRRYLPRATLLIVVGDTANPYQAAVFGGRLRLLGGWSKVRVLDGGLEAWKRAGLPIAVGWDMAPLVDGASR